MSAPRIGYCTECDVLRLLMPVRICAGSVEARTISLCVECRINWRDDKWACLATTIEHSPICAKSHPRHHLLSEVSP